MPLLDKIQRREAVIGVIGLGYVGLPLAVLQAKTGYRVVGIDEAREKVERVTRGENYISDVDDAELRQAVTSGRLTATTDFDALRTCDIVLICVPTPLTKNKEPDISAILKVTRELARRAHPEMLVVLESTTYPGTTEEVMLPILSAGGLKAGQNFYLAFSPERVDPGNRSFKTHNTFGEPDEIDRVIEQSPETGLEGRRRISDSCRFIPVPAWAGTAFRWIPITSPGNPGSTISIPVSSSWPGKSTRGCRITWWPSCSACSTSAGGA